MRLTQNNFDLFLNGLQEDEYGNIIYTKDDHSITLNYTHHQSRNAVQTKVSRIENELNSVKEKIRNNLIENVEDQNQKGTIVEYASVFDMSRKIGKTLRIEYLKQLFAIYGTEYSHTIPTDTEENTLKEYKISIKYPAKLKCTEEELLKEFNSLWPIISRQWHSFKESKPSRTLTKRFWVHIMEENCIEYPNLSDLVLILFSISPGTGPLERSFSPLAKICYKDRGNTLPENLETLYLLKSLKIDKKDQDSEWFSKSREILQKKGFAGNLQPKST